MDVLDRYDVSPEAAWLGTLVTVVVASVVGALAFPRRVYDGFIWRYFWGPVEADASDEACAVKLADGTSPESVVCDPAAYENAILVTPGYTIESTIGYMLVLVFMLIGVYYLLQRFDLAPWSGFFYALVPFMLFGGALRVVEDSFVAARRADVTPAIEFPWSALLISPFIYFTVFVIALASLLVAKGLERADATDTYRYPLAGIGSVALAGTFGYLLYLSMATEYTEFYPAILVTVVGLASILSVVAYYGARRYWPAVTAGTGAISLVVIWGHAIDGVANVIASDWTEVFGLFKDYGAKHPFNRLLIDVTASIQPGWLTDVLGDSWPFLVVKILVPMAILVLFDEEFRDESPRFAIMLLGAILAVGLGPGTRDMIRITFGI